MIKKLFERVNHSGFKKYLANTVWVFGERILRILSALIVGVWVTRYLGPNDFGIFTYAQSFVAIFLSFSTLGLNKILVRELVSTPDDENRLLGTTFVLQTVGSIILFLFLIIGIFLSDNDSLTNTIIVLFASVTFLQSFGVIDLYFQSIVKSKLTVFISVTSLIITSLIKITLILVNAPLIAFVLTVVFDGIYFAVGLIFLYSRQQKSVLGWKFSKSLAISLLKDSWPLILSGIFVSIYMKVDQVMIKELMDSNAVGLYSAAARLSEAWYFIPGVISASLYPAIVNAKKRSEGLYYQRLQRLYDMLVVISFSIALPMTFLSDWLVHLLYGPEFIYSGKVLSIHIWAGLFVFLGVARGGWIVTENLQRYTAVYLGAGMLANIVLNIILIPDMGILGAAYATLFSQMTSVLIAPALIKETRISFYMMIKSLSFYSIIRTVVQYIQQKK